jgi:hypothetical protein
MSAPAIASCLLHPAHGSSPGAHRRLRPPPERLRLRSPRELLARVELPLE